MIFRARPNKLVEKNGKLNFLELVKTKVDNKGILKDIRGSNFKIKADHIILAIGQKQEFKNQNKLKNVFFASAIRFLLFSIILFNVLSTFDK